MMENKSTRNRLLYLDSRIIWILLIFVVAYPLLYPIGIPVQVSQITRDFYNVLEDQSGGVIALALDTDPAGLAELGPQITAILHLAREKNIQVIMVGWNTNSGLFAETYLPEVFSDVWDSQYGVTFVNLGYIPGQEIGMKQFAEDTWTMGQDHYGNPISDLPMMEDIRTAEDIDYIIEFCWNIDNPQSIMRQFVATGYTKMLAASTALVYPSLLPFIGQDRSIHAAVKGMDGAAQLELLVGHPGEALSGTDAQSLAHILLIIFIALGNIGLIYERRQR
jgi:hypothetical protein